MSERRILVVDHDQKNLRLLEVYFGDAHFKIDSATSDEEALKSIERTNYDVMLCELNSPGIDGFSLLKEIQRDSRRFSTDVIFLSSKSDVWNRVKSLKLGVKDYIVKPVHVREIVARVNMILQRGSNGRADDLADTNRFSGRLEDLSVIDLIEILGIEKKTGVLSLINENGSSGQIVFNRGNVFSANTVSLHAEEAVYKTMNWNRGRFTMFFGDVDADDEMMISNMGMLLQGAKRMDLRNELLKQLPSLDAVVITTSNFKKILAQKEMNPELKEFLTLFDGERTLGRIIDDCRENEIVTLKRIVKLYKLGFLHVLRDFAREQQPLQFKAEQDADLPFDDSEDDESLFDAFRDNRTLFETEKPRDGEHEIPNVQKTAAPAADGAEAVWQEETTDSDGSPSIVAPPGEQGGNSPEPARLLGNILVIGANDENSQQFVESLTSLPLVEEKVKQFNLRYGQINFKDGNYLTLLSVSIDQEFSSLVDHFKENTLGYIFLFDGHSANWSYYRYLMNVLRRKSTAPIHVVFKSKQLSDFELQEMRIKLNMTNAENLHVVPGLEAVFLKRLFFMMLKKDQSEAVPVIMDAENTGRGQ
jgi:DNA-binding response OmpR family regulator